MNEPWKCPECGIWINPSIAFHRCDTPKASVAPLPEPKVSVPNVARDTPNELIFKRSSPRQHGIDGHILKYVVAEPHDLYVVHRKGRIVPRLHVYDGCRVSGDLPENVEDVSNGMDYDEYLKTHAVIACRLCQKSLGLIPARLKRARK